MAEENLNPAAQPEMTPAQARMAKAREAAAAKRAAAATERVTAPATEPEEVEKLRAEAEQAKAEAQAMEEALKRSEEQRMLEQQDQKSAVSPVQFTPPAPQLPRTMRIERSGNVSAPMSVRWPQIRGGTCEFCGVLDRNTPAQYQYKLCPHFRGMAARCTYCPENKDPDEVTYHANLNVATHPEQPGVLIMWCNSYACSDAHIKRWSKATA